MPFDEAFSLEHSAPDSPSGDLSCSSGEEGVELSPLARAALSKRRAQRDAFNDFLSKITEVDVKNRSHSPGLSQPSGGSDELSKKIIDQARDYQQELFERAKDENIIAVLGTGSGKTLIAALLLKHTMMLEIVNRANGQSPRIAFFLVNSVHLVHQQAKMLHNNLPTPPIALHGSGKEELRKRATWDAIFEHSQVVVCTPAILDQCLSQSFLTIDRLSLIIFDEAHHAKKGHPYARIMLDYYVPSLPALRPKIFGMTASPVDSNSAPATAAETLEQLLHSKIATTRSMSLLEYAPRPNIENWVYHRLPTPLETPLHRQIQSLCDIDELRKSFIFARDATSHLGSWCANQVWQLALSQPKTVEIIKHFELSKPYTQLETTEERGRAIENINQAARLVEHYLLENPTPTTLQLSSKVLLLYEKLSATFQENPNMKSIVFVDQRLTASLLADCFLKLKVPNMRPGVLLGVASGSVAGEGADSSQQQEKTMEKFRAGLINCVFATSVAEEGIDVPQCSLVVRFDLYNTVIQYMQSRGRARMKNSIYAQMVESGNMKHQDTIDYAFAAEEYLMELCASLPEDRLLGQTHRLDSLLAKSAGNKTFQTSAGAICSFNNSLVILSRYVSSLKYEGALSSEISFELDIKDNMFIYKANLPDGAGIRGATGEPRPNKALAKKSAAWNCCLGLRHKGFLDENLDSIHHKHRPENANAHLAVSAKKREYMMKIKPDFWRSGSVPTALHATLIHFIPQKPLGRPLQPIILLTRLPLPELPSFPIYFEDDVRTDVIFMHVPEQIEATPEVLKSLSFFTFTVFEDVFNKLYQRDDAPLSYWIAPANFEGHIVVPQTFENILDAETLFAVGKGRQSWAAGSSALDWCGRFLVDPWNGKYHYFTNDIVPGETFRSQVPLGCRNIPQKGNESVIDFSDSHWKSSKKRFHRDWDECQPVLSAEMIQTRRNYLDQTTAKEKKTASIDCWICPEPLQASALVSSIAATCLAWPAIVHRIESYLITLEAVNKLHLEISPDLALEAFTKDSNTEEGEDQEHTAALRGMGKNYERLEFIGDSLLKMTTTLMVFIRYPKSDELGFHVKRMMMLCNANLFNVATDKSMKLFQYVRTSAFNRATWYPEHLVLLKGRGAKKVPEPVKHADVTHDLGQKTIADVSEAIIGAALLSGKNRANKFDMGIRAITKLVRSKDHDIDKWSDIPPLYTPQQWSIEKKDPIAIDLADKVMETTGYKFKNPRLLRSAFTHTSDTNSAVPDYERMEFLGDAVLDMVCINWMFDRYEDRNPQWLTEHKMAMVSNKFLAALSVVLGFDKLIFATTTALLGQISTYSRKVRDIMEGGGFVPDFWTEIESPPKALSDLVESYIGAVMVDSGFDYSEIEKFFANHILWFFDDISLYDSYANKHPTSWLYKKLSNEYKCRDYEIMSSSPTPGVVETSITAGVLIHKKVVASSRGDSARYAKVRASRDCLSLLNGLSIIEFREKFGCNCPRAGW